MPSDTTAEPGRRRSVQVVLLALRLANALAKFALAVYMARFLGLAEVGVYGLLVGAATAVPAILGFGLNDWTARHVVGAPRERAIAVAVSRFTVTAAAQVVLQATIWGAIFLLDPPIGRPALALASAILLLEHLAMDDYVLEIARERPTFANLQFFLRAGFWPLPVIGWGLVDPAARTLEVVLGGWLVGLLVMWGVVLVRSLSGGRWRLLGFDRGYLGRALPGGVPFWLADIGAVGNLYLDRFIVSAFLGLETTGVYTFFWSFANVVHTLSVNGIVQPLMPRLIAAERSGDPAAFAAERGRLTRDTVAWAAILAAGVGIGLPLMLPWFERPLLEASLPVFFVVLVATAMRIGADGLGYVLYALGRDRAIAATALAGVAMTATFDLLLVPSLGLPGAAVAFLLVGLGLFAARARLVGVEMRRRGAGRQ